MTITEPKVQRRTQDAASNSTTCSTLQITSKMQTSQYQKVKKCLTMAQRTSKLFQILRLTKQQHATNLRQSLI